MPTAALLPAFQVESLQAQADELPGLLQDAVRLEEMIRQKQQLLSQSTVQRGRGWHCCTEGAFAARCGSWQGFVFAVLLTLLCPCKTNVLPQALEAEVAEALAAQARNAELLQQVDELRSQSVRLQVRGVVAGGGGGLLGSKYCCLWLRRGGQLQRDCLTGTSE